MSMSHELVRRLAERVGHTAHEIALLPVLVLWAILSVLPTLVPDLRRVVAADAFGGPDDSIATWLDRHFELIEAAAPWLRPAGRLIVERCVTRWDNRPFAPRPDPPPVTCTLAIPAPHGCAG